jgi:hypothetical protein
MNTPTRIDRRDFFMKSLPAGAGLCLGCALTNALNAAAKEPAKPDAPATPAAPQVRMTAEDVFSFSYGEFIPVLQALAKEMGREKCLAFLTRAVADNTGQMIASMTVDWPKHDIAGMAKLLRDWISTPPWDTALTYEVSVQTDKVLEMKYTHCLAAKLLRDMGAADIGYALECSGGEAAAKAFNPKMRCENPKNIMKGDSVCIERFILEA